MFFRQQRNPTYNTSLFIIFRLKKGSIDETVINYWDLLVS